jgi:hypothetical protein
MICVKDQVLPFSARNLRMVSLRALVYRVMKENVSSMIFMHVAVSVYSVHLQEIQICIMFC